MKVNSLLITISMLMASELTAEVTYTVVKAPDDATGPPWYADFGRDFIPTNGRDVAIVFWRDPDKVPEDFNLLDFFDPPRAFGESFLLTGTEYHEGEVTPGTPPKVSTYENAEPLPVYFVSDAELRQEIADDRLTISDLKAFESLRKGMADHSRHYIILNTFSSTAATGALEDGTSFFLNVFERADANPSETFIETEIQFGTEAKNYLARLVPEESGGPPWYPDISREYIPTDDGTVALLFWRDPGAVPADFNLLDLLDIPRAWQTPPLFKGVDFLASDAPPNVPPPSSYFRNTEAWPVYFIDRSELDAATTDDVLTIEELNAFASRRTGRADHAQSFIRQGQYSATVASGSLDDGGTFFVSVLEHETVDTSIEIVEPVPRYEVLDTPAQTPGPPWYADLSREYIPSDGSHVPILFWRNPDRVPGGFNLLDLFDAPRAFGEPILVKGRGYHEQGAAPGTPPVVSAYENVEPMPVYFVEEAELRSAIADDLLTLTELRGLSSLRTGKASEMRSYIRLLRMSTTVAMGEMDDNREPFFFRVFETSESIKTDITFGERQRVDSTEDTGGAPQYVDVSREYLPTDANGRMPLLFYRDPAIVPKSFNLLDLLDVPRAWGFDTLITGVGFKSISTPANAPPSDFFYSNALPMPIYFVDREELNEKIVDDRLTIDELNAFESLLKGTVRHANMFAKIDAHSATTALGELEDGTAFFVDIFEQLGSGLETVIQLAPAIASDPFIIATTEDGMVTQAPDLEAYPIGSEVTVTATPEEGFEFVKWIYGDEEITANPATIIVQEGATLTPYFAETEFPQPLNIDIAPAVVVSWDSQSDRVYQIHRSADMNHWEVAIESIEGTGERLMHCFVREETEVFYRVEPLP